MVIFTILSKHCAETLRTRSYNLYTPCAFRSRGRMKKTNHEPISQFDVLPLARVYVFASIVDAVLVVLPLLKHR
jgi:hypothetical protein